MVHRDLSFFALLTLEHVVMDLMVDRQRSTQMLHVCTPFLPGAGSPTLSQALLAQIIAVYLESLARDVLSGKPDILNEERGIIGDEDSAGEKDGQEEDNTEGRCSQRPRWAQRGKGKNYIENLVKKRIRTLPLMVGSCPWTTLSSTEQVALSKVMIYPT